MSIKNKLPKAPEGYEWVSSVNVFRDENRIYLRLEPAYTPGTVPKVPESSSRLYVFCQPREESMIGAAHLILERFEEGVSERDRIVIAQAEASKKYRDLIIKPGD